MHHRFGYTLCQLCTIFFRQLSPLGYTEIVPLDDSYATDEALFVLERDDESETGEIVWVDVRDELWVGLLYMGQGDDFDIDDLGGVLGSWEKREKRESY